MSCTELRSCNAMFVHVPKTAGYSVTVALRNSALDAHQYPVHNLRRPVGVARYLSRVVGRSVWSRQFTFCFVRNPWDWAVSGWKHVTVNKPCYTEPPSFEEFLCGDWRRHLGVNPLPKKFRSTALCVAYHTKVTQWQHLSLGLLAKPAPFSYIGRFENLADDWQQICDRLGIELPLPHENKSSRDHYSSYYSAATRRLVERQNRALIERFGYRFDSV